MKEEIITKVLDAMYDSIGEEKCRKLKGVLYMVFQGCVIMEESREIQCVDKSYEHYLGLFLSRKRTEGKSERTLQLYKLHLSRMLQILNKNVGTITENDLFCYLAKYKKDRNVSNAYLNNMRLVFSSFFTWLNAKGYITQNPASGLETIKKEQRMKKALSDEELECLRRNCVQERDLAIIEFLYSTGVRVSELTSLNRSDVNFDGKNVIVYGKGSKERETYLNATACMHLKEYLNIRSDKEEALFVSIKAPHTRLTVSGVEEILRKLGRRTGIEKVHPHRFRRTMATNMLKKGMPVEEVKILLGHVKLDTTMIYCNVDQENVRHSHQKYMSA